MSAVAHLSDYQTQEVVIDGITVKQNAEGRYCPNDVHKASGGNPAYRPGEYLRYDHPDKLVAEPNAGNHAFESLVAKRGRNGGTYAAKELVYAYAAWVSPAYHLKVIRDYDRTVTEEVPIKTKPNQTNLQEPNRSTIYLSTQSSKSA